MVNKNKGSLSKVKRVKVKSVKQAQRVALSMEVHKKALSERLDLFLKQGVRFVPECETEYTIRVYNRVLVRDCDNITENEEREMSDALIGKGQRGARAICSLNEECPNFRLLRYRFDRIVCENRLWEVDLTWIFKCVE